MAQYGSCFKKLLIGTSIAFTTSVLLLTDASPALAVERPARPQDTGRLHTISWNACDRFGSGSVPCTDNEGSDRAVAIENMMLAPDFLPIVASLQEICYKTYRDAKDFLGDAYRGDFKMTVPNLFARCGGNGKWGVAYIVKAPIVKESALPLPDDESETRVVLCGRTTIFSGFRVCTTHLTPVGENPTEEQVGRLATYMSDWALDGAAVTVGGDMNMNALWPACDPHPCCPQTDYVNRLKPLYYGNFGQGAGNCGPGTNYYYEADNERAGGDGVYDQPTIYNAYRKLDYIFFNYQRFNSDYGGAVLTDNGLSDHLVVRAAMTVHD